MRDLFRSSYTYNIYRCVTMARKPGSMYRQCRGQVTSRKEYLGGIPNSRITQFQMGNRSRDFPVQACLHVDESCQIRHNSLEAARIAANRSLDKALGAQNYKLHVRVFPHAVIRENKQATGAGADRVSQGMRSSYGKNVGTAARLKRNQILMSVDTAPQNFAVAKNALRKASMKICSPCTISIDKGEDLVK